MPPKDDLMMGLDGQDRRDMREKLRREAAQKDHAAHMMERYAEMDRIKKEAEEKRRKQEAEREAALKRKVAEKLALEAKPHKLFVAGDAFGNVAKLFATAEAQALKVKGIEALLCVGRWLPEEAHAGLQVYFKEKKPPLETHFIDSSPALLQAAPQGCTLAENLHFLGGYGIKTICGLRVAFLSGYYDAARYANAEADFVGGAFTRRAVQRVRHLAAEDKYKRGVDILLTNGWPAGLDEKLEDTVKPPLVADLKPWQDAACAPLAELCAALEPRYHLFGTADIFYQRPPFKAPRKEHACRCIGLGHVASKRKWLHALSLNPMDTMRKEELQKLVPGTTACPFARKELEPKEDTELPAAAEQGALGQAALRALQDGAPDWRRLSEQLEGSLVYLGNANAELRAAKRVRTEERPEAPGRPEAPSPQEEEEVEEETPEAIAARQKAHENLSKPPKKGIVRYTFRDDGLLGIRLSRDVPPWILEVRDGTLAARKAPKVPVGGVVTAINGYDLSEKENPRALRGLAKRPVVLDVDWPMDVPMPPVNSA